jgi:hypothetical protein
MAAPCRTSTEHPNPDLPREVPREKEITQHTYLESKGRLIAYPAYWRNMTSTPYRNHSTKWRPISNPPKTHNPWLRNWMYTRSPFPVVRCTRCDS